MTPAAPAPLDPETAHRMWALENVKRNGADRRKCGHAALTEGIDFKCLECAHELGRREGQVEAGAYHTGDEVFSGLRKRLVPCVRSALEGAVRPQELSAIRDCLQQAVTWIDRMAQGNPLRDGPSLAEAKVALRGAPNEETKP